MEASRACSSHWQGAKTELAWEWENAVSRPSPWVVIHCSQSHKLIGACCHSPAGPAVVHVCYHSDVLDEASRV